MPLGSEFAYYEIVNVNVTEAESAGLSGRGADGAASAGAIPTTSAKPQRTSNAGSRPFNALLLSGSRACTRAMGYTRAIPDRFRQSRHSGGNRSQPRQRFLITSAALLATPVVRLIARARVCT